MNGHQYPYHWAKGFYNEPPFANSIAESHAQDLRNRLVEKRHRATNPKKIERLNIRIDRVTAMLAAIKLGNP